MSVEMTPRAIAERLREAGRRTDLAAARRLDAKIGLDAEAIARRLRTVSELRDLCLGLRRLSRG